MAPSLYLHVIPYFTGHSPYAISPPIPRYPSGSRRRVCHYWSNAVTDIAGKPRARRWDLQTVDRDGFYNYDFLLFFNLSYLIILTVSIKTKNTGVSLAYALEKSVQQKDRSVEYKRECSKVEKENVNSFFDNY